MQPEKIQSNIPKKAMRKPSIVSLVFFIIIVIIYVPNTLSTGLQALVAFFLAPLAIVGLFLAYNSGMALAKYNYDWIVKKKLFLPYLALTAIHIICIGGCLVIEIALAGYPIRGCFDICTEINITTAIVRCCTVSAVLFLPAYCAIYIYYKWVIKYNLPKPTDS